MGYGSPRVEHVSQEINRVYAGALGPVGVVPYTYENARGIDVVGVIDGGKGVNKKYSV